jgi:hypothetical protein
VLLVWLPFAACGSAPVVAPDPTWADVEPILRAECSGCHGGTAETTGSAQGIAYRLDFYDLTSDVCGEAAAAMPPSRFAAAASSQIAYDITSDNASVRPKMPPQPAPWLADWEWQTLLRWARDPQRGPTPPGNRPPKIRITSPTRAVKGTFTLSLVLEDPDGESAIAVVTVGDVTFKMDRPGTFAVDIDASQWPAGPTPVSATVCDGWQQATYDERYLGVFDIGQ